RDIAQRRDLELPSIGVDRGDKLASRVESKRDTGVVQPFVRERRADVAGAAVSLAREQSEAGDRFRRHRGSIAGHVPIVGRITRAERADIARQTARDVALGDSIAVFRPELTSVRRILPKPFDEGDEIEAELAWIANRLRDGFFE